MNIPNPPATLAETPFAELFDAYRDAIDEVLSHTLGACSPPPAPPPGDLMLPADRQRQREAFRLKRERADALRTALLDAFAAQARRTEEAERELRRVVQETGGDPETWMGAAEQVRSRMCEHDQLTAERRELQQRLAAAEKETTRFRACADRGMELAVQFGADRQRAYDAVYQPQGASND